MITRQTTKKASNDNNRLKCVTLRFYQPPYLYELRFSGTSYSKGGGPLPK